jgi:hypothetical protein
MAGGKLVTTLPGNEKIQASTWIMIQVWVFIFLIWLYLITKLINILSMQILEHFSIGLSSNTQVVGHREIFLS